MSRNIAVLGLSTVSIAIFGCGEATQPKAVNQPCRIAADCADHICHHEICAASAPTDLGQSCRGDGECVSFTCTGGRCMPGTHTFGESCLHNEECASATCSAGKCTNEAVCGDGVALGAESCDGTDFKGATCVSQGFDGGDLACTDSCALDTSPCFKQEWIDITPGTFTMGSPPDEPGREVHETQHQVTLTRGLRVLAREVTMKQFELLRHYNPSFHAQKSLCTDLSCPVEQVDWSEAAAYCHTLSEQQKLKSCYACTGTGSTVSCSVTPEFAGTSIYNCPGYRLPTDAEWEYAYRAGSTTAYYGGLTPDAIGWYKDDSAGSSHPGGGKKPNAWGLYDMAGNVWEWCNDWYQEDLGTAPVTDPAGPPSGIYRVTRGGSWQFEKERMRAAHRLLNSPSNRYNDVGFRCVRSLLK